MVGAQEKRDHDSKNPPGKEPEAEVGRILVLLRNETKFATLYLVGPGNIMHIF